MKLIPNSNVKNKSLNSIIPDSVIFTCISPILVLMCAGIFSLENALYGAIIFVAAICHDEPNLVTVHDIHHHPNE